VSVKLFTKDDWPAIENSSLRANDHVSELVWNAFNTDRRKSKISAEIVFPTIHSTLRSKSRLKRSAPEKVNAINVTPKRKTYPLMVQFYRDRKERIKAIIRSYLPTNSNVSRKQLCRYLAKIKRTCLFEPLSVVLPKIFVKNESGRLFS
jgi:hypothetical protein